MPVRLALALLAALALTAVPASAGAGSAARTNGKIVFSVSPGEVTQLVTADLRSRRTTSIELVDRQTVDPVLSPDGRFVAFHRWVGDLPPAIHPLVGVRRLDGGRLRWIAPGCEPAWSPSGKELVFIHETSTREHCVQAELAVVRRDGSRLRGLYSGFLSHPSWSPNGRWLAFLLWNESASRRDLYVIRPDGSEWRAVAEGVGDTYDWAPDSRRIAVVAGGGLQVASVNGGPPRRLAQADSGYGPRWSPNGRWIAYAGARGITVVDVDDLTYSVIGGGSEFAWVGSDRIALNTVLGIRLVTLDGSLSRLAVKAPFGAWYADLRSLGGARGIAFRRYADGYGVNLYTIDPRNWAPRRLTAAQIQAVDPAVSPDGSRVAFTRVRPEGNHVIAVVGSNGRGLRTLTHNRYGWDYQPSWSPDGRRIVFVRGSTVFEGALFEVRAGGGTPRLLWSGERPNHPAWAPDGQKIALDGVLGRSSPTRGIRLVTPGRAGFVELTHPPEGTEDVAPSWSPDGTKLAFVRRLRSRWTYERVFVLTVATGEERPITDYELTDTYLHPFAARWSPDGSQLVVRTCIEPGFGLCYRAGVTTMAPDGTGAVTRWARAKLSALDVAWAAAGPPR